MIKDRIIRINQFIEILGVKRSTFYRLKKQDPKFPKVFYIGERLPCYLESDVNAYITYLASKKE